MPLGDPGIPTSNWPAIAATEGISTTSTERDHGHPSTVLRALLLPRHVPGRVTPASSALAWM